MQVIASYLKNDPMPDTHLGEAGVLGAGVPQDPALEPFAVLDKIIIDIHRLFSKQSNITSQF